MLPCFGFGWGDYQLTTYPVDLLSHLECPGFKIQVIPLKGADPVSYTHLTLPTN